MTQQNRNAGFGKRRVSHGCCVLVLFGSGTYVLVTHVDQSVAWRWCRCTDSLCPKLYEATRHPASVPCDRVFPTFVNDTGLSPRGIRVGAPSLCSPLLLVPLLHRCPPLPLSLTLSLYLLYPFTALCPFPSGSRPGRFDQRWLRSRRTRDDQWGINAILVRRPAAHLSGSGKRTRNGGERTHHGCRAHGRRKHTHGLEEQRATPTSARLAGISNEKARWVH